METQAHKSPYLLPLIAGIAVILFSGAGIARIVGENPIAIDTVEDVRASDQLSAAKVRCAECGVFVSMRETGAVSGDETRSKSTASYEITVRMADGSSRVINDANPASWRPGERMIVIGGVNQSNKSNPLLIAQGL